MVNQLPAVDITENSDLTPISREPIKKVNKFDWENCSITELNAQLETLVHRKYAALNIQRADIARQIQRGIDLLQDYIHIREQNTHD